MKKRIDSIPAIPMAVYKAHQSEIALHMSHFLLDYLRGIYEQFDGDLAMVIVLGEIAHHNMAERFDGEYLALDTISEFHGNAAFRDRLPACNAYSLANATGLPRETIRRKIVELEKRGWIERGERREVRITPKVAEHFEPDFNLKLLVNLLKTADRIRGLLTR